MCSKLFRKYEYGFISALFPLVSPENENDDRTTKKSRIPETEYVQMAYAIVFLIIVVHRLFGSQNVNLLITILMFV